MLCSVNKRAVKRADLARFFADSVCDITLTG
jgi:hypothetical protein